LIQELRKKLILNNNEMKKIYIYTLSTLLLWGAASCKKPNDFGKTNVDPTAVTTPIPSALLANVMAGLGGYASTNVEAISGGQYAQYFAETQYPGTSTYSLPQIPFTGEYGGNLIDLQGVITLNPNVNTVAVAKILQQYLYWTITDTWGDVPYSQALLGLKNITPAYDKQEDIYKGILTNLKAAIASMDNSTVQGDLFYGGDATKWKKMANSLIMLVAIQASKAMPASSDFAGTAFAAAFNDAANGYIKTNSDNFTQTYPGASFKDPWWNVYNGRSDYAESKTVTDLTAANNDGRTGPFGGDFTDVGQQTGGTITSSVGVPPGLSRGDVTAFTAANPKWAMVLRADQRTATSPVVVIGAAEVNLAIAEAINIGWVSGDLTTYYHNGINASFAQWGLAAPSAGFFTGKDVLISATASPDNFKNISIQRYLASYPDGHMAWDIWRKTATKANPLGYPALTPAPGATNSSKQIVRRFTYVPAESQTNGVNVKAAVAREVGPDAGTDSQDNHVWWDVYVK
jgi:hypothetical protein